MSVKSSFQSGDDELDRLVGLGVTRRQVEPGDDRLECLDPEILASYADDGVSEAERADIDNHLGRCRDCRRALALLLESDPASMSAATPMASPLPERRSHKADNADRAGDRRHAPSGSRILHSAKTWLPLAAALVVATGLWFAFDRTRQSAGSAPAFVNARNESSAASQAATQAAPREGAAPQVGFGGAPPSAPAPATGLEERGAAPADRAAAPGAGTQERESARGGTGASAASVPAPATTPERGGAPAASAPAPGSAAAGAAPAAVSAAPSSPAFRAREARRDGFAAARPEADADGRDRPAALARPGAPPPAAAAAPPPPPPPATLADAAPARSGVVAGRDGRAPGGGAGAAQAGQAVGQIAGQAAPSPSPAQAPAAAHARGETVVDASQAKQAQSAQANQANQATQNVAQQTYAINQQQTGPSANLNTASPPPSKTDDRRQADAAKREANEKTNTGGPSSAKSADEKFAKVAEEPKAVARAKAAPESAAAAPAPAEPATRAANAASGGAAPPPSAASGGKASDAVAGRAGAAAESTSAASTTGSSGASTGAADRSTTGTRAGDTATREINEAVTVTSTGARTASGVLRSADGTRWWRIRVPGTIEGSADRGATWTVEYSEPLSVIVRGAAGSKSGCWMVGRGGLVLRARPEGGWEAVKQPTANTLVMVTATDHLIAAVTDDRGRTWRTIDGGVTWR